LGRKRFHPQNPEEPTMQYKTIILELLQQRPQMHQQLQQQRKLLTTMEAYAKELKASHEAWKEQLAQAKPGSEASQISSEAFEMALKELEERLPPASRVDDQEALALDQAMAFIRDPSSRS
jgi:chromosome segregation ATPase